MSSPYCAPGMQNGCIMDWDCAVDGILNVHGGNTLFCVRQKVLLT